MGSDHDGGYGKPPRHSQFKQGQSGNPKGRPKGSRNFSTEVKAMLKKRIRVTDQGESKTVSSLKAALLRLCDKALKGDARELVQFLELGRRAERDRRRDPGGARCEGVAAGRYGENATRHPEAPGHTPGARRSEWCFSKRG